MVTIPAAPPWLLTMLERPRVTAAPKLSIQERLDRAVANEQSGGGLVTVFEGHCADLASTGEGSRRDTLALHAFDWLAHAKGGHPDFPREFVESRLRQAALQCGLGDQEIDTALRLIYEATETKPYTAPAVVVPAARKVLAGAQVPTPAPKAPEASTEANQETEEPPPIKRPFTRIMVDIDQPVRETRRLLRWLYGDGCFTMLQSEPGLGKSWLALWAAVQLINQGQTVVYLDEEGGPDLVHERLVLLGANAAAVNRHLWLYCFESRTWDHDDQRALTAMLDEAATSGPVALGVLDSLPDHLTSAGLSEDKAQDVTAFMLAVGGRLRAKGVSTLMLDHLVKPSSGGSGKSRYARGSGAKLAKADATLLVESDLGFDAQNTGLLRMWKTKDRRGKLDLPQLFRDDDPLGIQVKPEGNRLLFEIKELVTPGGHLVSPERATGANILRLFREKIESGGFLTQAGVMRLLKDNGVGRAHEVVRGALDELITVGVLTAHQEGQDYRFRLAAQHLAEDGPTASDRF